MVPECGERPFRARLDLMGIPSDGFFVRTLSDGMPLRLGDPRLLAAVHELRPVVVLDSAIRFNPSTEENSAAANKEFSNGLFGLLRIGARGVIGLHHSPKTSANEELTLENVLRGTGDLAAICDVVYGLKSVNPAALCVRVENVKARDFDVIAPFQIQGRPHITNSGDFQYIGQATDPREAKAEADGDALEQAIKDNPTANYRELEAETGIATNRIQKLAERRGFKKDGKRWIDTAADPYLRIPSRIPEAKT